MAFDQSMSGRVRSGGGKHVLMRVFFLIFLIVGAGLAYPLLVRPAKKMMAAQTWEAHPCTIVSSDIQSSRSKNGITYRVAIRYRYAVGENDFESGRYGFADGVWSSGYKSKQAILDRYPAGAQAICYVNPLDPAEAVLSRGWENDLLIGIIPAIFLLIGILGLVFSGKKVPKKPSPSTVALESRNSDGLLVLKSGQPRVGAFVFLALFALVWNGVVWGVWFLGEDRMPVFLFALFGGIGLLVVVFAIRQFLVIFNPRPVITVNSQQIVPGETLRVEWTLHGDIRRVRKLRVFLEGQERATYRRGTDTSTDTRVFANLEIASATERENITSGASTLFIPDGTMHSFAARNNEIRWTLRVVGEIPHWPDIDDDFPITILSVTPSRT